MDSGAVAGAGAGKVVREGKGKGPLKGKKVARDTARKKPVSRSSRAGLEFPVGRIHRHMKSRVHASVRIAATAAVYTAAMLEYVAAEVLELAGNASKDLKMKRISPRHLQLSIRGDEDLDTLIKGTIAGGGVIPHINKALLLPKPPPPPRLLPPPPTTEFVNAFYNPS